VKMLKLKATMSQPIQM